MSAVHAELPAQDLGPVGDTAPFLWRLYLSNEADGSLGRVDLRLALLLRICRLREGRAIWLLLDMTSLGGLK